MPSRDYRVAVYHGTKVVSGADPALFGRQYTWALQQTIWAEVVQLNNPPTNMQSSNTFASEFKVILQTPLEEYSLELTRFVYTRRGRTRCLQPYRVEVNSGTRVERSLYRCKQVEMIALD